MWRRISPAIHEKVCRLPAVAARMIGHENGNRPRLLSQWVTMKGESYKVQQQRCAKGKQWRLWNRRPFMYSEGMYSM